MRSHINLLQRSNLVRLIILVVITLLIVGAILSLSAAQTEAASPASPQPGYHPVTTPGPILALFYPPDYDDPSYFETLLRQAKHRLLQFISLILKKWPVRQYPFRLPNNTLFWLIIPL